MSTVAAIGRDPRLAGFALVGVTVWPAGERAEVEAVWAGLAPSVGLVILGPEVAPMLEPLLATRPDVLSVVLP